MEKVIAYGSFALTKEQRRYCTTRKELLAVVRFTRQFRHYLLGKPFTVRTEEDWRRFRDRLNMPEVVALGEVGLERNEPPNQWYTQMLNLEKALDCLGPNHVLVLHCRSVGTESDEAWLTILMILKAHRSVGREHLIHCHCFTGSRSLAERWIAEYPSTYFGFTSVVSKYKEPGDHDRLDWIRHVDPGRILLETDAPYFPVPGAALRRSTPAALGYTAAEVAKIRSEPWRDLLQRAATNTERLYVRKMPPELA
ncbi:putative deoxyribonuclease TATDN2 [Mercenaria mercenaria]|uniref:putative deoxyribonuclease TATDN2 n=1 Tax=Mercenaria mercenaria TaxID=6596 RepID=UPI00234E5B25|nr:putative deoxyribonuclease TATDN2 [Mercenaria mercenaria]